MYSGNDMHIAGRLRTGRGRHAETAETMETAEDTETEDAAAEETGEISDQEAADNVAALIDAIYVQERTDETDAQCTAAKGEAWDALTDAQKELVAGEFADPDYFGRDTGDASLDDPRNQDEIGENEILVVSFGTSLTTAAWQTSRELRTPSRRLIRTGPSEERLRHRSSSTMCRPGR